MSYIGNEPIVSATRTITEVTATAGQTVFTANGGYTVGYIDVFLNGAQLQTVDFTATNGTTITLTEAAQVGDVLKLVAWGTFSVASINGADIVDGTVGTAEIADSAITTAKIAAGAVVEADIADGAVTTNKLSNSGVTAGTYGSASAIPAVTVDAKGRITSVTTNAVSGGVSSLNGQTGAITNTDLYAIGSYIVGRPANGTNYNANSTIAGSSLRTFPTGVVMDNGTNDAYLPYFNTGLGNIGVTIGSGTWRCTSRAYGDGNNSTSGLWVRIS